MCRPYGGDVASPGGASGRPRPTKGAGLGPAPAAEFGQKTAGAQCAPLQERGREPAPSSVWPTASHLPLKGKATGDRKGRPYGENAPGALAEKTQALLWNRTRP